jgi:hypothetical protein
MRKSIYTSHGKKDAGNEAYEFSLRRFNSLKQDGKDYCTESIGIARPADSLGRLGAAASGLPRGSMLLGEDGILVWAQRGRRFTSGMVLFCCELILFLFRLMTLAEELLVS